MIALLSTRQALGKVACSVFLSAPEDCDAPSHELLAQAVRRAVAFMAPCPAYALIHAVAQSFSTFVADMEAFAERVALIVEELIVYGDILEMRESAADSWVRTQSFILRPAPPSFIKRRDGSFVIAGIAGEQITPLTAELNARIAHRGVLRILPASDEDLESLLFDLGLLRLPERTWLRLPTVESAINHVASWRQALSGEPSTTVIEALQILDTATSPTFYKGRWVRPERTHTGMYVARRPQRYGAPLWCLVELDSGSLRRFKDLSSPGDRLRPFDIAWRIQAALDAVAENPQRFDSSTVDASTTIVRFYSPVPSWCERYLSITGEKKVGDRSLFCFDMPTAQQAREIGFLREFLWMTEKV